MLTHNLGAVDINSDTMNYCLGKGGSEKLK